MIQRSPGHAGGDADGFAVQTAGQQDRGALLENGERRAVNIVGTPGQGEKILRQFPVLGNDPLISRVGGRTALCLGGGGNRISRRGGGVFRRIGGQFRLGRGERRFCRVLQSPTRRRNAADDGFITLVGSVGCAAGQQQGQHNAERLSF